MGAAFNAVRGAILGSSMRAEGEFLLAEIAKQDGEIEVLMAQLADMTTVRDRYREDAQRHMAEVQRLSVENAELRKDRASVMVREFHETYGVPILPAPAFPSHNRC